MSIDTIPKGKRSGRRLRYGQPTIQRPIYPPPVLIQEIDRETLARNFRAGNPDAWNFSRVVIDILMDHFGLSRDSESAA